jgi:hypothetical protein
MDEPAFRAVRSAANPLRCVFEKALLSGCVGCEAARKHALAERETIACALPVARNNCATLIALLRERSAFALKLAPGAVPPHALMIKLQCGGLAGLRQTVAPEENDVHRLIGAAHERHGSLADLPWPAVVAAVLAWQGRRRHMGRTP